MSDKSTSKPAPAEPRGAPWHAAVLSGLAVLVMTALVYALGGSLGVGLILAVLAFALVTVITMGWPERFGGQPPSQQ